MGYKTELEQLVSMITVNLAAIDTVGHINKEENICNMVHALKGPVNQLSSYIDHLQECEEEVKELH
tara:strand:- start:517 stop:714 length:198 start_codon:yes stop_codon:yes gene_type:complete